jgi:hypothetical protein
MNIHMTGAFEKMALRSLRNYHVKSLDWNVTDTDGNTALHLLFSTGKSEQLRRRYGDSVRLCHVTEEIDTVKDILTL